MCCPGVLSSPKRTLPIKDTAELCTTIMHWHHDKSFEGRVSSGILAGGD